MLIALVGGFSMKSTFFLAMALATGLVASAASAQPARTFVSSFGSDTSSCSIAAPCRTLQRGIDAVAASGDVLIVDSGGFGGNVVITKSVSVIAPPGAQARLRSAMNSQLGRNIGILVNGSDIAVSISGLGITSDGVQNSSVYFQIGKSLTLSGMDIDNGNDGFAINHRAAGGHLTLSDTIVRNASQCFVSVGSSSAPARATILRTSAQGCSFGFQVSAYSKAAITQSHVVGNANCTYGYLVNGQTTVMTLDSVVSHGCTYGVYAGFQGTATLSNSVLTGNANAGFADTGAAGVGRTFGNNRIFGNGINALTGFTSIAEQ